tara:strand:- start:459 stop:680 length:222 start_codon:yes stop_codon:yes gene_type:complete
MILDEVEYSERPEISAIRVSADSLCHLAVAYSASSEKDESEMLLDMIKKHSDFLVYATEKIFLCERLHIKQIK